jgi:hypothetical protein
MIREVCFLFYFLCLAFLADGSIMVPDGYGFCFSLDLHHLSLAPAAASNFIGPGFRVFSPPRYANSSSRVASGCFDFLSVWFVSCISVGLHVFALMPKR